MGEGGQDSARTWLFWLTGQRRDNRGAEADYRRALAGAAPRNISSRLTSAALRSCSPLPAPVQSVPSIDIPLHTVMELTPKADGTMAETRFIVDVDKARGLSGSADLQPQTVVTDCTGGRRQGAYRGWVVAGGLAAASELLPPPQPHACLADSQAKLTTAPWLHHAGHC